MSSSFIFSYGALVDLLCSRDNITDVFASWYRDLQPRKLEVYVSVSTFAKVSAELERFDHPILEKVTAEQRAKLNERANELVYLMKGMHKLEFRKSDAEILQALFAKLPSGHAFTTRNLLIQDAAISIVHALPLVTSDEDDANGLMAISTCDAIPLPQCIPTLGKVDF